MLTSLCGSLSWEQDGVRHQGRAGSVSVHGVNVQEVGVGLVTEQESFSFPPSEPLSYGALSGHQALFPGFLRIGASDCTTVLEGNH